jgi:hypothetical protein
MHMFGCRLLTVAVCGAVKQKMVFVFNRARHAHKTDPVLSVAMFAVLAKAARVNM